MPWVIKRLLAISIVFQTFLPFYSSAQETLQTGADSVFERLESICGSKHYLVFYKDTVLSSGQVEPDKDIFFIGCRGAIDLNLGASIIIVNGELELRSRAEVSGDVILVRSEMFKSQRAVVSGQILRTSSDQILKLVNERLKESKIKRKLPFRVDLKTNRMGGFALGGYDRVDGFSVSWGMDLTLPDLENFVFFQGKAITATTRQSVGYDAVLMLPLDPKGRNTVGVGARSKTDTNDRWRLDDLDNAFKAFIVGYDNRYYFRREGYSVYFRHRLGDRSQLTLGYLNERYYSLKNLSPFTLFGSENFRPNLPVSSAPLRSVYFDGIIDTRNDPFFTLSGFQIGFQGELAGGALGGKSSFARIDLSVKRWDTYRGIHHTFLWVKWAWADERLPFQRCYTLGNTMRGYDNFAFSGDRMLLAQAAYGLSLPNIPVVEYLFFRWRMEFIYETGTAFFKGDPLRGYGDLKKDAGFGFSGNTLIGRIGIHLFQNLNEPSRPGPRVAVTLNINVSD